MASLSFEPASEAYDEPLECDTRGCTNIATVRFDQTHQDDGESWPLCTEHAIGAAAEEMAWLAADGETGEKP